jgi:glycine oxidase
MLAPWCERERAEPLIQQLGEAGLQWWLQQFPGTRRHGSLVIAAPRDGVELTRFAARTTDFAELDATAIAALEPDLAGRFERALYFPNEAHLDPRAALAFLATQLQSQPNVTLRFGCEADAATLTSDFVIDCRGLTARNVLPTLRGVKGEMLVLHAPELYLQRPLRLLHPRFPLYLVPHGHGVFMVGATMLESDDDERITARSIVELLNAAYSVHPAFAEAHIVELGTQVRPAFADNLPRLLQRGNTYYVNGLYRHGLLLAPALAQRLAAVLLDNQYFPELMHEDSIER